MEPETFYAVVGDQLVGLERHSELPEDFLAMLPGRLDTVLAEPALRIGGWADPTDGPLVLALSSSGQLVSIVAANEAQTPTLDEMLATIDSWLSTLRLRDVSELSGNHKSFYDGLWDLSPDASITLATTRRYVVLTTSTDELDVDRLHAQLPSTEIEVHYHDVLHAPGGPAVIRRRSVSAPSVPATVEPHPATGGALSMEEVAPAETRPDAPLPPVDIDQPGQEVLAVTDAVMESPEPTLPAPPAPLTTSTDFRLEVGPTELASPEPELFEIPPVEVPPREAVPEDIEPLSLQSMPEPLIDLTRAPEGENATKAIEIDLDNPVPAVPDPATPNIHTLPPAHDATVQLRPGQTFQIYELPTLFDPLDDELESIGDEMFAVRDNLTLVAKLPERRRETPFEERDRFRWDTSFDRIELLEDSCSIAPGVRRSIHLFVEADRQPGIATYVGELTRITFESKSSSDRGAAWFSVSPPLENDLFRSLKKGKLPQATADLIGGSTTTNG